jgi:hypothetical protein
VDEGLSTKTEIADFFEFDERQGDYYANAGRYLGLLKREKGNFLLTNLGRRFTRVRSISGKSQLLIEQLLIRPTFRTTFELLLDRDLELETISNGEIAATIEQFTNLSGTTPMRRASTVRSWFKWILKNSKIAMEEY